MKEKNLTYEELQQEYHIEVVTDSITIRSHFTDLAKKCGMPMMS
jgi:hypothetical protein